MTSIYIVFTRSLYDVVSITRRRSLIMFEHSKEREARRRRVADQNNPALSFKAVNWGRVFSYLKPYWGRMGFALLALLASSGFGLGFPLVIVRLLDSVTKANSFAPLNNLALMLMGIFLLQALFSSVQSYLLSYIGEHIVFDLRTALYAQLQKLSLSFYSSRRVGDIVSRLSSDVTQMRTMLTNNVTGFLCQIFTLIGSIVIVLTMNVCLSLFLLPPVPVLFPFAASSRRSFPPA